MNGILLFNKPILWTSHDAVDFVRRRFGMRAVGHAGTLDPMATGLLVLLVGSATKRSAEFMGMDKEYQGTMLLGLRTDTQDLEGRILERHDGFNVERARIEAVFGELTGNILQSPPAYSAVRVKGRKSYELARKGLAPQPEPRPVEVRRFEVTAVDGPEVHFKLVCSKGTYVRALCDEIGSRLGCGGVLSSLVRTRVGPFELKDAAGERTLSLSAVKNYDTLSRV